MGRILVAHFIGEMMRFLNVLLLIGLMALAGGVSAQKAVPDPCTDPSLSEFGGNWKEEVDGDECLLGEWVSAEFHAAYPKALAERSPFAKSVIFEYINQERRKFWKFAEFTTRPQDDTRGWIMTLNIKSELFQHSDDIASVLFSSMYLEGQGRVAGLQTFTFDLKANKLLDLTDIFVDGVDPYLTLAPFTRDALGKNLEGNFTDSVVRVSVPTPENYTYWALTDKSLLLFFSGFSFGGGAGIGMTQTAEISLQDLKDYLRPEFLPKP
jgi:hypothetical protein